MDQKKINIDELLEKIISDLRGEVSREDKVNSKILEDSEEPVGPMSFEQALFAVKKAKKLLNKELVFWMDNPADSGNENTLIYFFTYVKGEPFTLMCQKMKDPTNAWEAEIEGTHIFNDWYVQDAIA